MTASTVEYEGHTFALSNLDKILWPQDQYTKGDMIAYYSTVAEYIIDHLRGRPLVLTRYPNGIQGKSFYQKNAPENLPAWIATCPIFSSESNRTINYIMMDNISTIVWLANLACIEIHPWFSKYANLDYPDYAAIDLDPSPGNNFRQVVELAGLVRQICDELKIRTYIKTSGARGLHIYIPVINNYTYQTLREFAQTIARIATQLLPDLATIERTVAHRGPKIYVDYLQNVKGKTLCSVYSIRPHPGAPVSCPVSWEELPEISPADFTIKTILPRLQQTGDLFAPVLNDKQSLDKAITRLQTYMTTSRFK